MKMILLAVLIVFLIVFGYFFIGVSRPSKDVVFGVNFSQLRASRYDPDWPGYYLAVLDDLKPKHVKLGTYWNLIEKEEGKYDFSALDWQIEEAAKRGVKLIVVIGRKTPGWPECHVPEWAEEKTKEEQQEKVMELISLIVERYKDQEAIEYWQVENEPFFPFGKCLWKDKRFLLKEIDQVRSIDPTRPVIITDSGEFSLWLSAAKASDVLGVTMYRRAWFEEVGLYIDYPFSPIFYTRKANLIKAFFKKDVFCIELQAEPWGPVLNYKLSLEDQKKTMDIKRFKENIEFARKTNLGKFYLWGAEWWYWMKEKNNQPEFWEEAKKLFK